MATKPKASLDVSIDEKGPLASLKAIGDSMQKWGTTANQSLELVSKVWGKLNQVIGQSIELAAKQQAAEARLLSALNNRTRAGTQVFQDLQKFNTERQRGLGIDADELTAFQARMLAQGVHAHRMREATDAAIGLARITGGDLNSSSEKISKLFTGNAKALAEMGIQGKTTEEVIAKLGVAFQQRAAEAVTFSGRVNILSNDFDDLRKKIGRAVTDDESVNGALLQASLLLREVTERLDTDQLSGATTTFGKLGEVVFGLGRAFVWLDGRLASVLSRLTDWVSRNQIVAIGLDVMATQIRAMDAANALPTEAIQRHTPKAFSMEFAGEVGPMLPAGFRRSDNQVSAEELSRRRASRTQAAAERKQREALLREIENEDDDSTYATSYDLPSMLAQGQAFKDEKGAKSREKIANAWTKGASAAVAEYQRSLDDLQRLAEREAEFMDRIGAQVSDALGDHFSQMVVNIANGSMSVLQAIGGFIGGIITQLGVMLIQMGTAAVLAGTLGTVLPIFAPLTGGPAGIGAGLAAIAGGAALVAIGSAISGASSPGGAGVGAPASANPGGGPVNTRSPNGTSPNGFWSTAMGGGDSRRQITINVGMLIGTDERRAGRQLRDLLGNA